MEDHSIDLKPTPRTELKNLHIVSSGAQREPDQPQFLPSGKSLKMAEGDSIFFVDVDVWSKGVFLEDTAVEGPLVFAREPNVSMEKVAKDYFAGFIFMGGAFGALMIILPLILFGTAFASNAHEVEEGFWSASIGVIAFFCLIGGISLFSAIKCYRRTGAAPAKYMRDHDLGRTFKVFLPKEMNMQGAA